jgi:hypothetical protein
LDFNPGGLIRENRNDELLWKEKQIPVKKADWNSDCGIALAPVCGCSK